MEINMDNKKFSTTNGYLKYLYSQPYKENKNKEVVIKTTVDEFKKDLEDFRNEIVSDFISDLQTLIDDYK